MTDSSISTTSSNDLNSHHGIHQVKRLRSIKLTRPHTGTNHANLTIGHPLISSFGFSLRGGREFGTGFFISNVMKGSEADVKGLRIGDQIIRVGNSTGSYRVDDAVHKELSQFIASQNRLILKVRGELYSLAVSCYFYFLSFSYIPHCCINFKGGETFFLISRIKINLKIFANNFDVFTTLFLKVNLILWKNLDLNGPSKKN